MEPDDPVASVLRAAGRGEAARPFGGARKVEDPGPDHIETTVEIGLDDDADGTRVTVVETGFEALEPTSMAGCAAVSTWIWDVRLGACGDLPLMLAR